MKKIFCLFMIGFLIVFTTACGSQESESSDTNYSSSEESSELEESVQSFEETEEIETEIDVDLTLMSTTMAYVQIYNIVMYPDDYIGETIKMTGEFALYQDPTTEIIYCAVVILDETACCMQGLEFVLTDEYAYPDDYPEQGEQITVIGEFSTYEEYGITYGTLINTELV